MNRKRALGVLCVLLPATMLWSCDETQVTGPDSEPQAIVGRIISDESNVEVSAWQAQLVASTVADDSGYFALESLPIGIYEIRIVAPSGKTLNIQGITVAANQTTSLKEIRLTTPTWPLSSVYPRDSAVGVQPLSPNIQIVSTQQLDLVSLAASTSFIPAIDGTWRASGVRIGTDSYFNYLFTPVTPLEVATKYTLRIGPGLAVSGGQNWGDSLVSVFLTDSLRVQFYGPTPYATSSHYEITPNRSFDLYITFNALVNADSLTAAVTFAPPLEGVWVEDGYYSREAALKFFYTGDVGLKAEQTYLIEIDGTAPLVGPSTLGHNVSLPFTTAAVKVIHTYPPQGDVNQCASCPIQFIFNSEMDSLSLASAFALESLLGDTVAGTFNWTYATQLLFTPDSALTPGAVYIARLDATTQNQWGDHLKEPYALYFRVRQ